MRDIEALLKNGLVTQYAPDNNLNQKVLNQAKEIEKMKSRKWKTRVAAAIVVGVISVGSMSVYAAYRFLSPSQVAEELTGCKALSKAFESEEAIVVNETQTTAGYNVTFLGMVSGKALQKEEVPSESLEDTKTYAVVAIEKQDGTSMPQTTDEEYKTFCVSVLINGSTFMELNNGVLNAGVSSFVMDGIQYELLECDDLQIFSGRGVYMGVVERFGDELDAYSYQEEAGTYKINEDYQKINALFTLPLDTSKADEEQVQSYIHHAGTEETDKAAEDVDGTITGDSDSDKWLELVQNAGNSSSDAWNEFVQKACLEEEKTQILTMDKDGYITIKSSDDECGGVIYVKDWSKASGVEEYSFGSSDGTMQGTEVVTIAKDEDGKFIVRFYVPAL